MDDDQLKALHAVIRKSAGKAGMIAGVTFTVTLLGISALFFAGRWTVTQIQEADAASAYALHRAEEGKVSPSFLDEANKVAAQIKSEHQQSKPIWKTYKPLSDAASKAADDLYSKATTDHERQIAQALSLHEHAFSFCVEMDTNYPILGLKDTSHCETEHPVAEVDAALKAPY